MKTGFCSSSERNKCVFCGKRTYECMEYSENGIDVRFWCHYECRKNLAEKIKPLIKLLYQATKDTK